jgi:hypothetical protein
MTIQPNVYFIIESSFVPAKRKEVTLYPHGKAPRNEENYVRTDIKEYTKVTVHLESDDPNTVLEIETYKQEGVIKIKPGQKVTLAESEDSVDMLVPGDYPIVVRTSEKVFEAMYRIHPKNMTWESLMNLREYLESKLTGLSYNLLKRRSGSYEDTTETQHTTFQIFQHIQKEIGGLKKILEAVFHDPLTNVKKEYREQVGSRRPD